MAAKKQKNITNSAIAGSFKSPLFLAIAICFSVMFLAVLITTVTMELGIVTVLALIFSGVSTLCAWLLFATPFGKGKLKNLRLYIAYRKIMNTFAIIFVSIIGAVLVAGCFVLSFMSDMIKNDLIPVLESDVKPIIDQIAELEEQMNLQDGETMDLKAVLEALSGEELTDEEYEEIKAEIEMNAGVDLEENTENIQAIVASLVDMANELNDPETWDAFIEVLETDFMTIAIIVAVIYVIVIVGMTFVSSASKRTSKYLKALAKDENTDKKSPYIIAFIGAGFVAVAGFACFVINAFLSISALVYAATLVLFALFFKQIKEDREENALAAEAVDAPVAAEAVAEETVEAVAEETVEAIAEETVEAVAEDVEAMAEETAEVEVVDEADESVEAEEVAEAEETVTE